MYIILLLGFFVFIFLHKFNFINKTLICLIVYFFFNSLFFNLIIKSNFDESVFWCFVEILNNNNKSIFLFSFLLLFYWIMSLKERIFFFNKLNCILYFILILSLLVYNNYIYQFNHTIKINFNINTSLINGVVLIHPILIYITYILLLTFNINYINNIYYFNKVLLLIEKNKLNLFLYSFVALFLGGWWAQQELNWGGWWNWDFVEIIALIFNILTLYVIHNNFFKTYNNLYNFYKSIFFYLIFFFLFVRVDILNSIHSFNTFSIIGNFDNMFIILVVFLLSLFFLYCYTHLYKFKLIKNYFKSLPLLFKLLNFFFLFYFFLNLFYSTTSNYQFVDVTKFLKFILIQILYTLFIVEFFKIPFLYYLVISNLIFNFYFNYFNYIDVIVILNLIFIYKTYLSKFYNNNTVLIHFFFYIFFIHTKYNNILLYFNDVNFTSLLNNFIINSSIFQLIDNTCNLYNLQNIIFLDLHNYIINVSINNFYQLRDIYTNTFIVNNTSSICYNVDGFLFSVFYKLNIIICGILFLF